MSTTITSMSSLPQYAVYTVIIIIITINTGIIIPQWGHYSSIHQGNVVMFSNK